MTPKPTAASLQPCPASPSRQRAESSPESPPFSCTSPIAPTSNQRPSESLPSPFTESHLSHHKNSPPPTHSTTNSQIMAAPKPPAPSFPSRFAFLLILTTIMSSIIISLQQEQPFLDPAEQDAVFNVLSSVNSDIPWRTLFPDDLCVSAPHGVVCSYFVEDEQQRPNTTTTAQLVETAHITELSFGYVSDFTPNPPCTPNSTLSPLLFNSFKYLRKLFFYKCFTETPVSLPNVSALTRSLGENLEELVFVDNPALVGPLDVVIGNFTNLRRLILTGNGISGEIPDEVGDLVDLEEITLSRNQLSGGIPAGFSNLKKLRLFDLSQNFLEGNVPDSMGNLSQLLKLDLSSNGLSGKIPDSLINLQSLEFLDLSFNHFGNSGIPLFLGGMPRLREVYLSGNLLGGQIPEIWGKLGGIVGIGFSSMGLVGKIPSSMALQLRSLCYLGLDNNRLEGGVPQGFGLLESLGEINLENNNLSGRVPSPFFTAKIGQKLKLNGNSGLCVGGELGSGGKTDGASNSSSLGQLRLCNQLDNPSPALFLDDSFLSSSSAAELGWSSSYVWVIGWFLLCVFA